MSAGDEKRPDLSLPQQLIAALLGALVQVAPLWRARLARIRLHRPNVLRQRDARLVLHMRFRQLRDLIQMQRLKLPDQLSLTRVVELIEEPKDLLLSDRSELFAKLRHVIHAADAKPKPRKLTTPDTA